MSDLFGNHIVGFPTRRLIYAQVFYLITAKSLSSSCLNHSICGSPRVSILKTYLKLLSILKTETLSQEIDIPKQNICELSHVKVF